MLQTVIKIGNSLGFTIPKNFIKQVGIQAGEKMLVETSMDTLTVVPKTRGVTGLTPEFVKSVNDFIKKYKPALVELAKK